MFGGRWNPAGMPAIYAAGSMSLAMLERLVQRNNLARMPIVEAFVPDDLPIADLLDDPPPNWRAVDSPEAVAAGGAWLAGRTTAVLRVPSAIVPREANYVIDPAHPDAARIVVGAAEVLVWDPRLFGVPALFLQEARLLPRFLDPALPDRARETAGDRASLPKRGRDCVADCQSGVDPVGPSGDRSGYWGDLRGGRVNRSRPIFVQPYVRGTFWQFSGTVVHDGAESQKKPSSGVNADLSSRVPAMIITRPVPSLWIVIGEPQWRQKRRCIGSPVWPPGLVKVVRSPVSVTRSAENASAAKNAEPVWR